MTSHYTAVSFDHSNILAQAGLRVRLESYFEILRAENRKVNLVSRETISAGLTILAAESVLPLGHLPRDSFQNYLDIGSGGGFPAIPIVLTGKVGRAVLIERTSKKFLAMGRIVRSLGGLVADIELVESTFEEYRSDARFDLITMRLVKPTTKILRRVGGLLSEGGFFVYYSSFAEDLDISGFSCLSYRYETDKESPAKFFSILQKKA